MGSPVYTHKLQIYLVLYIRAMWCMKGIYTERIWQRNEEAKARQPPKREWLCMWWKETLLSSYASSTILLFFLSTRVLVTNGSSAGRSLNLFNSPGPPGWNIHKCSCQRVYCHPSQCQEHGGHRRRIAVTWGELDRAVEGQQRSSRDFSCSFWEKKREEFYHNTDFQPFTGVHVSGQNVRQTL